MQCIIFYTLFKVAAFELVLHAIALVHDKRAILF